MVVPGRLSVHPHGHAQILQTTQQHLAYPVLHHFHARTNGSSAPRALAALDDALLIMSAALPEQDRPSSDTLTRLRRAIEHYAPPRRCMDLARTSRRRQ